MNTPHAAPAVVAAVAAALALLGIGAVLTGGRVAYPIDDPYIHLAYARGLLAGQIGLDPLAPAVPCSSIAFPLAVAAGLALGLGAAAPLAIDLASLGLLAALIARRVTGGRVGATVGLLAFGGALTAATSGMEHMPQIALVAAAVIGLADLEDGAGSPLAVALALGVAPWVRYESVGLTLIGAVGLARLGRGGFGALAIAIAAAGLGAHAAWLLSMGLPPLPSSVLAKSGALAAAFTPGEIAVHAESGHPARRLPLLLLAGAGAVALWRCPRRIALGVAVATCALHAVVGSVDGFARYEAYAVTAVLVALARRADAVDLAGTGLSPDGARGLVAAAVGLFPVSALLVPIGMADIADQHGQIAAFVRDGLRAPIAANDVGRVSWEGGQPVLDLFGLASEEARIARMTGADPEWMARAADRRGVQVAFVYTHWFPRGMPASWRRVGTLRLGWPAITVSRPDVAIYATPRADPQALDRALDAWKARLPAGATLERP